MWGWRCGAEVWFRKKKLLNTIIVCLQVVCYTLRRTFPVASEAKGCGWLFQLLEIPRPSAFFWSWGCWQRRRRGSLSPWWCVCVYVCVMGSEALWGVGHLWSLLNIRLLFVNNTDFPLGNLRSPTWSRWFGCIWGWGGTIAASFDLFQKYANNLVMRIPSHGYNGYKPGCRWAQNPSESSETHSLACSHANRINC